MTLHLKLITFFSLIVTFLSLAYSHNSQSKETEFIPEGPPLKTIISDILTNLTHDLIHGIPTPNNIPTIQHQINNENKMSTPESPLLSKLNSPYPSPSHIPYLNKPNSSPLLTEKNQEISPPIQNVIDYEIYNLYDTNTTLTQYEDYLYTDDELNQYGMNQHNIIIHAPVTNITQNTIEISPVTGQPPVTIQIDTHTQIYDQQNPTFLLDLSDIIINDFVYIIAFDNHEEHLIASEITLSIDSITQVQGMMQKDTTPFSINILNIEFIINENTQINSLFLVTQNEPKPPEPTDYPTNAEFSNALIQYYSHVIQHPIQAIITTQAHQSNIAQTIVIQ